jgi:hypothetical protein
VISSQPGATGDRSGPREPDTSGRIRPRTGGTLGPIAGGGVLGQNNHRLLHANGDYAAMADLAALRRTGQSQGCVTGSRTCCSSTREPSRKHSGNTNRSVLVGGSEGRTSVALLATVSAWVSDHGQNLAASCRDQADAHAQAPRDRAPGTVRVADRWHLWHMLAGHVEIAVNR